MVFLKKFKKIFISFSSFLNGLFFAFVNLIIKLCKRYCNGFFEEI